MPEHTSALPTTSRRSLLTAAAAITGAVALGQADAAVAHETPPPAPAAKRRKWIHLKLGTKGQAVPVPLGKAKTVTGHAAVNESIGGSGVIWVSPLKTGLPGTPADTLVIETGESREEIDVWIEPEGGLWFPAGPTLGMLDLGIVAMHAALLRKPGGGAEVVMYSIARRRDQSGALIPNADRPGQWEWDIFSQNDVEVRALDLATFTTTERGMDPEIAKNIFCSGQGIMPQGRLLTVGGHRTNHDSPGHDIHNSDTMFVYEPGREPGWVEVAAKLDPLRWYPTVTALPDGLVLIASGATVLPKVLPPGIDAGPDGYWNRIANDYQIFDPKRLDFATGSTPLIDQSQLDAVNQRMLAAGADPLLDLRFQQLATYPGVFVVPGRTGADTIVVMAESNRAWLYSYHPGADAPLRPAGAFYPMHTLGSRSYPHYGSAVLLPLAPDSPRSRVLVVGGQHEDNAEHRSFDERQPATSTAEIFDIDPGAELSKQPGWRQIAPMRHARILCDATLLADGQVLISGGAGRGWGNANDEAVYESELFDPGTEKFRPAATAATDRRYHSVALLQPDGTLLKAGSTGGFGDRATGTDAYMQVHTTAERYYPPYLWRGPRPSIKRVTPGWNSSGRTDLFHGGTFTITATGPSLEGAARAALIRPGAITHGNNMDQRYVWLHIDDQSADGDDWSLTAAVPANPAAAPPGDYLLVVVDSSGVPSPAEFVRVAVPLA